MSAVRPGFPLVVFQKRGGVLAVKQADNLKTGPCAITHVAQASCPPSCRQLRDGTCYANHGRMAHVTKRLNDEARAAGITALALAREEARQIDALPADRPLRVHGVGDCRTIAAAKLVGAAMVRYAKRGQTQCWSYTHAWRRVPVSAWMGASVLASCETADEVREAEARGYPAALIVGPHRGPDVYELDGLRILPCPRETGGKSCAWCGICAQGSRLLATKTVIGFYEKHGATGARPCGS